MTFHTLFLSLSLFLIACTGAGARSADDSMTTLQRLLSSPRINSERISHGQELLRFYQTRDYQLAWSDGRQLRLQADELLDAIPAAANEGLNPGDYHLPLLTEASLRFRAAPTPQLAAELDLLLSDAFISLASHYRNGRIAAADVDPDWDIPREQADPVRMLKQALQSGRIRDSLQALLPTDPAYAALRNAWQDMNQLAAVGGWPRLKVQTPLRPGARGAEVTALAQRLSVSGDLPAKVAIGEFYDLDVEAAVRRFQSRHGLVVDGIVGPATLSALNVPAVLRARQLALNLERWRWLPRTFGPRYLRVNLPAFALAVVEEGKTVLSMRVIVGRQLRPTPAFVGRMTYLVLNPYWNVPRRLAVEDLLPKIQAHSNYLAKEEIEVLTVHDQPLDAANIDWQRFDASNFPYHLRQRPGRKNALGQIKLIFPNPYDIYLHDTPHRELFGRDQRSFSSGCIRIEKPLELAGWLLRGTPQGEPAILEASLEDAVNTVVTLPSPVAVYLLYLTAWVSDDGTVNFPPDLYQRDARLDLALRQPLP